MPPKVKVTKEEIIAAALEILRQKGMEAVNARAVAAALGCSTQPIFSNYSSMGALQHDVLAAGYAEYNACAGVIAEKVCVKFFIGQLCKVDT